MRRTKHAFTVLFFSLFVFGIQPATATTCQSGGKDFDESDIVWSQHHKAHLYCAGNDEWRYLANWGLTSTNNLGFVDGNVGIGTADPERKMEIVAGTAQNGLAIAVDNDQSGINLELNSMNAGDATRMSFQSYRTSDGVEDFGSIGAKDGKLVLSGSGNAPSAPHMVIDNSGNVGIGTVDPQAKLHIDGSTISSARGAGQAFWSLSHGSYGGQGGTVHTQIAPAQATDSYGGFKEWTEGTGTSASSKYYLGFIPDLTDIDTVEEIVTVFANGAVRVNGMLTDRARCNAPDRDGRSEQSLCRFSCGGGYGLY